MVLPFDLLLSTDRPIYEQIVLGVKRAVVRGRLRRGQRFPTVREIARELKVNPNTVQKAISELSRDGILEGRPGQGTVVALSREWTDKEIEEILRPLAEQLVVEAVRTGYQRKSLEQLIRNTWKSMQS